MPETSPGGPTHTRTGVSFSTDLQQGPMQPPPYHPGSRRTLGRSMSMQVGHPSLVIPGTASPGPTPASTPTVGKGGMKSSSVDSQVFDKLLSGMQKEVEASQKLKQENQVLRGMKKDADNRAAAAEKEAEEVRRLKNAVEEQLSAKDQEIREMEARLVMMQEKLVGRERLEQEVKILSNRILAMTAVNRPQLPPDQAQEVLLQEVGDSALGFSPGGHPVAATIIYKSLIHWRTFEAERTNTFDRVVDTFQQAARDVNINNLSYWLTNTVWLYFLIQEEYKPASPKPAQGFLFFGAPKPEPKKDPHVDTMLFKLQLGTSVDRLYVTIRDNVKAELQLLFQPNGSVGGKLIAREGSLVGGLPRSGSIARRQVASYWTGLLVILQQTVETLQYNQAPPFLVHALLKQLLTFVDVKIFNSLMVRSTSCPCTYSNGEVMESGLQKVLTLLEEVQYWLEDCLPIAVSPLANELCHIQQAVAFLLCEHKPSRSIDEIRQLCPDLSMNQLVHICIWYEDDKYNTKGVEPAIIERMWELMVQDSPMLLRDDESIPFTIDELVNTLERFDLDEVDPPPGLLQDGSFIFLLPAEDDPSQLPTRTPSVRSPLWGDTSMLFGQPPTPQMSRRYDQDGTPTLGRRDGSFLGSTRR